MTSRPLAEAPYVDPLGEEARTDPETVFRELRERTGVARTPLGASIVHRDLVQEALLDPRFTSAVTLLARIQGLEDDDGAFADLLSSSVIAMDGPDQARLRRLVARSFTPPAADRHRPVMTKLVDELVDAFAPDGRCEFVTAFGDHYPIQVICEVLGVPREDHEQFGRWGDSLTYILSLELGSHLDEVSEATEGLFTYVSALVEDRSVNPRDDLVTSLVQASEGEDRLSHTELLTMIGGLIFAGFDTTRNQLGFAMDVFCDHPDQWRLLGQEPDLAAAAVAEVMRLAGAVSVVPRIASEDVEIGGYVIPAGTFVMISLASANRDERFYDEPLTFDITAERTPHMTFGHGPHHCLGASLARAEMEEALKILPHRMPNLRRDGESAWRQDTGIQGPITLPLAFDPS